MKMLYVSKNDFKTLINTGVKIVLNKKFERMVEYGSVYDYPKKGYLVQYDIIRNQIGYTEDLTIYNPNNICQEVKVYYADIDEVILVTPLVGFFDEDNNQIYDGDVLASTLFEDKLYNKDVRIVNIDSLLHKIRKHWRVNKLNKAHEMSQFNKSNIKTLHQDDIYKSLNLDRFHRTDYNDIVKKLHGWKVVSNIMADPKSEITARIRKHRIMIRKKLGLFQKVQCQTDEMFPDGFVDNIEEN